MLNNLSTTSILASKHHPSNEELALRLKSHGDRFKDLKVLPYDVSSDAKNRIKILTEEQAKRKAYVLWAIYTEFANGDLLWLVGGYHPKQKAEKHRQELLQLLKSQNEGKTNTPIS